jgi:hypothetical protein
MKKKLKLIFSILIFLVVGLGATYYYEEIYLIEKFSKAEREELLFPEVEKNLKSIHFFNPQEKIFKVSEQKEFLEILKSFKIKKIFSESEWKIIERENRESEFFSDKNFHFQLIYQESSSKEQIKFKYRLGERFSGLKAFYLEVVQGEVKDKSYGKKIYLIQSITDADVFILNDQEIIHDGYFKILSILQVPIENSKLSD